MFVLYIYRNAFQNFRMGYASVLAWVLFALVLVLTVDPVPRLAAVGLLRGRASSERAVSPAKRSAGVHVRWSRVDPRAAACGLVVVSILPLLYMVSTSLKPDGQRIRVSRSAGFRTRSPGTTTRAAFTAVKTLTFLKNTMIVSLALARRRAADRIAGSLRLRAPALPGPRRPVHAHAQHADAAVFRRR